VRITDTADTWWKNTLLYCVDIEAFFDSNDDGIGDLPGVAERIEYLAELGVGCLWLMPFYPSPQRDDGYDLTDFYGVDPRFGSPGDLVELVETAHGRGLRVIVDLVLNHTSDKHPWFIESRSSIDSPFRDYYVWRSDAPPDTSDQVTFAGDQESIWTLDEKTGEWYLHRFYEHQPDLNLENPKVRDEIAKVVGYWLKLGVDGFRVDAVPQLLGLGVRDKAEKPLDDPHAYLRSLRAFMSKRSGRSVLLGEVNLPYEDQMPLFGTDDSPELTMMFDFLTMQRLYLSLARGDAGPLADALRRRPSAPDDGQWVTFVRNHDELTLDQLSEDEREEVFAAFAPEPEMRAYGRGIRRRLPPMLDGDQRKLRLVYSLLFSLPGTPALYYGQEIGMGDDLGAEGREAMRSPMQWTSGRNGGFSNADPDRLVTAVAEGPFGPEHVNVAANKADPDSLLAYVSLLARRYRETPELAWGHTELIDQPHSEVLAHSCSLEGSEVVLLHNLSGQTVTLSLDLDGDDARLTDLLAPATRAIDARGSVDIELGPYACRWLRVEGRSEGHPVFHTSTTSTVQSV